MDEEMIIGQSRILGKGIYYSEIIGGLISFALSPTGVCCIAVLPCAAFIVLEIIARLSAITGRPNSKLSKNRTKYRPISRRGRIIYHPRIVPLFPMKESG